MGLYIFYAIIGGFFGWFYRELLDEDNWFSNLFAILLGCICFPCVCYTYENSGIKDFFNGNKKEITTSPPKKEGGTEKKPSVPVQQKPSPKMIKKMTVNAELFHSINNYDGTCTIKDAGRKVTIIIIVYDDGSWFLDKAEFSPVSYSKLNGYEFECNVHNDFFAFNVDDIIHEQEILVQN